MTTYNRALLVTLSCAGLGVLLSGYLSYRNYVLTGCAEGPLSAYITCGGPKAVRIFEQPTCIYGFAVFLATFLVALVGLNRRPSRVIPQTLLGLTLAGTLFSGYLSVYELLIQRLGISPTPACVYGVLFFSGALIASGYAWRVLKRVMSEPPVAE